jgi:hypothetical protein
MLPDRFRPTLAALAGVALVFAPAIATAAEPAAPAIATAAEPAAPAIAAAAEPAAAPSVDDEEPEKPWETAPTERRGGFAMGVSLGAGFGAANGYPADSRKIGRERYYTESGVGLNTSMTVWLGGALADWLNFGAGMGFGSILAEGTSSPAPTIVFHTDAYPLYDLDPDLRDLGVTLDAGLGFASTVDTATQEELIQAPGASYVSAGVFWEPLEFSVFRAGPLVAGQWMFSDTLRRPSLLLGFRTTLYAEP